MTAATGAWAQQTLTVFDGTFYENYSPANICYIDEFTRSQTVIPSTALEAMKGCDITAMKFYSNSIAASGTIDYFFDVYLKEVSYTAFAESPTFEPKSSCTTVHQGKLSISNFELTITFSKPFHYNGGNLLLGMENNSIVTYYEIRFLGTNTGSSLSNISIHHATDLASATSITKRYFIPKTTFTYVVPTYTVKLADGTQDAANWTIASGENSATGDAADGLTGLKEGDAVTLTYGGRMKVKGVTATTDAAPARVILSFTSLNVGQVIGSDGKNYDYSSLPTGVTAVAKICYVSGNHGLALALTDEGEMYWSTAIETCAAHTPAITGGTWKLASKDEWEKMISAAGSFTALRNGFSSVGGTNLQAKAYYSSTEQEGNSNMVWRYLFDLGTGGYVNKDANRYARACLAF